jgi:hypothetical protein
MTAHPETTTPKLLVQCLENEGERLIRYGGVNKE